MGEFEPDTPEPSGEGNGLMYLEIAKMLKDELGARRETQAQAVKQNPPKRIALPQPTPNPEPQALPEVTREPKIEAAPAAIEEPEELPSLSEELAQAGPEEAAAILADCFEQWTPEQQKAAIDAFMSAPVSSVDTDPVIDTPSLTEVIDNGEIEKDEEESRSEEEKETHLFDM
jgi:hypothetical protein